MVASIGAVASPSQGAHYYERDGYYAKDSPEHRAASAWRGRGAAELGLEGKVDPDTFGQVLAGEVPDGSGNRPRAKDRRRENPPSPRPRPDVLRAQVGVAGRAGRRRRSHRQGPTTARWVGRLSGSKKNAAETRVHDAANGNMVRTRGQRAVIATFRHETSRNLDPALHTHSVIANMLQGPDGKWRTMANERLYASKMLLGAMYRSELAAELKDLGYGIERTHADGRFEIAGVSRETIEAFSTRRAEIEAAMAERGLGTTGENPHLARRAALMTRAHKRDVDRDALRETWALRAAEMGFEAKDVVTSAVERTPGSRERQRDGVGKAGSDGTAAETRQPDLFEHAASAESARKAVDWAVAHLSERAAVFGSTDLLAAALAFDPGAATIGAVERAVDSLKRQGRLHEAKALGAGLLTTEKAVADERETVSLMRNGQGRGRSPMRGWMVDRYLRKGPLTGRTETGREAHPLGKGPHGGRAGPGRDGQDHDAEPRAHAGGEKTLADGGAGPVGIGRPDAGGRIGHRERNASAVPGTQHRGCGRPSHEKGTKNNARAVPENRAGRRRGLAGFHRAGPGICSGSRASCASIR